MKFKEETFENWPMSQLMLLLEAELGTFDKGRMSFKICCVMVFSLNCQTKHHPTALYLKLRVWI